MNEQQDVGKSSAAKDKEQDAEWLEAEYEREVPAQPQAQIATSHIKRSRFGLLVVLLTFVGFGGWATFAHVDGAAVAMGDVIVSTQNRNIQHLEGGVVDTIFVDDGDQVEEGDTLVTLSDIRAVAELNIVQSQLDEILGEEARLLAERAQKDTIEFPAALLSRKGQPGVAAILDGQQSLFNSRTESVRGREQILKQKSASLAQQVKGQKAVGESLAGRASSYQEELKHWQELFDRQLADRLRINEMTRELLRLQGERDATETEVGRLRAEIANTRSELLITREEFMEKVSTRLREVQQKRADLQARKTSLEDTLRRLVISSPVSGTVVGTEVHTEGGVIRPGDTLMQIVPSNQKLAIVAKVKPTEIDRIKPGQLSSIRLSAFNFQAAHVIEAEVINISADTYENEQTRETYYEVRLNITEKGQATMAKQDMFLLPGMPAEVLISTGNRTVLEYLLDPFIRMSERAFRES